MISLRLVITWQKQEHIVIKTSGESWKVATKLHAAKAVCLTNMF